MSKKDFLSHINEQQSTENHASFEEEVFVPSGKKGTSVIWKVSTVLLAMALMVSFLMPLNSSVALIDLSGLTLEEAEGWALNNEVILTKGYAYSDDLEKDVIMSQDISDVSISRGQTVKVLVSKGFDPNAPVTLPTFDGSWTKNAIVQWLDQNGIENYSFTTQKSDVVEEGSLIDYKVIGGNDHFLRNSYIEFVTNEVSVTEQVEAEHFIGKGLVDVDKWSLENHVDYEVSYIKSDLYEAGTIISQSIPSGNALSAEEAFKVTISSGLEDQTLVMEHLVGDSLTSAITWLKSHGISYTITKVYSEAYSKDTVIDQSIKANHLVFPGDSLGITVSLGLGDVAPNYSMISQQEANDLQLIDSNTIVKEAYSDIIPKGALISQSVEAGSYYSEDNPNMLVYSMGNEVAIGDFRGESIIAFKDWLDQANEDHADIKVEIKEVQDLQSDAGIIVSQSVKNNYLAIGDTLQLEVSKGSCVPDFYGMSKSEIVSYDAKSMMTVDIVEMYYHGVDHGDFISQSIPPGELVEDNTVVTVKLSLGSLVSADNYMGKTVNELEGWVNEMNALGADLSLSVYEVFSNDVSYGKIVSQDPFNIYVPLGSDINVIVSKGTGIVVPDLSYYSPDYLKQFAEDNQLLIVIDYVEDKTKANHTFVSQSFEPHTEISSQQIIKVIYSKNE